jgi:hypothetical protein
MINNIRELAPEYREKRYQHIIRPYESENKESLESIRKYFETGDIEQYIAEEVLICPYVAIFYPPIHDLEHFKVRVKAVWDWLLSNLGRPADARDRKHEPLNYQFSIVFEGLFGQHGQLFPDDFFVEVFFWLYGEKYDPTREFQFGLRSEKWLPKMDFGIDLFFNQLNYGIKDHLFGLEKDIDYSTQRYVPLMDYFLSLLPYINIECYAKKRVKRFHKVDGKASGLRAEQCGLRTLIAYMHDIPGDKFLDEGYDHVPVNDQASLQKLKDGINSISMPNEYFELIEYLEAHRGKDFQERIQW